LKNQYVGDYNDFVKYALLRAIVAQELPLLVCWMLTRDDTSSEGGKLGYLEKASTFRHLDPESFDAMAALVAAGSRSVSEVEDSGLLPGAAYLSRQLEDHPSSRNVFFRALWRQPPAVTFFDPDNGFEVPSKPRGLRDSSKYVYWDEVEETFRLGHSVIVFQHFAREKRSEHLKRLLDQLRETTGSDAFALRSAHVAFLCAPQIMHERRLRNAARELTERWGPRLAMVRGPASSGVAREMLFDALAFAVDAHGRVEHTRKGTRFPYMIHPIRVAWILERHGYDDEIVAAGLLHDTIEDTDVTRDQRQARQRALDPRHPGRARRGRDVAPVQEGPIRAGLVLPLAHRRLSRP
jgi:HD domain